MYPSMKTWGPVWGRPKPEKFELLMRTRTSPLGVGLDPSLPELANKLSIPVSNLDPLCGVLVVDHVTSGSIDDSGAGSPLDVVQ
jgi:hypothetical protein